MLYLFFFSIFNLFSLFQPHLLLPSSLLFFDQNYITFNTLIGHFARMRLVDLAIALYNRMKSMGVYPDVDIYNTLLKMYVDSNESEKAFQVQNPFHYCLLSFFISFFSSFGICPYFFLFSCQSVSVSVRLLFYSSLRPRNLECQVKTERFFLLTGTDKLLRASFFFSSFMSFSVIASTADRFTAVIFGFLQDLRLSVDCSI